MKVIFDRIKLDSGVLVDIPEKFEYSECTCGAKDIIWGKVVKSGKNIPVRWDEAKGWITHFVDCPLAGKFRKDRKCVSMNGN